VHVYVLYSHPARRSFSRRVLESFLDGLRSAGHTALVNDLYATGFRPWLDATQYERELGAGF